MSLDLDPLCAGALAHPVTSSRLYLHLFNKALWCLTDTTRSARCDNSSTGRWLYICNSRCLPLGAGCCCRASGCSLLGCCRGNRWLCCRSSGCSLSGCLLISCWGWGSGDGLSSHFNLGRCVRLDSIWVTLTNVVSCSPVLSTTNNFDDVGTMIGCTYYSGREPQCPVIVDYRNSLSCICNDGSLLTKIYYFPPVLAINGAKMNAIDVVTSIMTSLRLWRHRRLKTIYKSYLF